jgi:hypothetical protein
MHVSPWLPLHALAAAGCELGQADVWVQFHSLPMQTQSCPV